MSKAFQSFIANLREHGLHYDLADPKTLRVVWESIPRDFAVFVIDTDGAEPDRPYYRLSLIVTPAYNMPSGRRNEALRLLNCLNCDRLIGSWEMDFNDGQLRYRVGFPAEDALDTRTCEYLLSLLSSELDRAMPLFLAVGEDGVSTEDACIFLAETP